MSIYIGYWLTAINITRALECKPVLTSILTWGGVVRSISAQLQNQSKNPLRNIFRLLFLSKINHGTTNSSSEQAY